MDCILIFINYISYLNVFLELTIDVYQWQEVTTQIIQVQMHDGAENEIMKENKEDLSICTWLQFVPMCSHETRTYFMQYTYYFIINKIALLQN